MKSSIIGLGEVGGALYKILKEKYEVTWFERNDGIEEPFEIMNVCIPWSEAFFDILKGYVSLQHPRIIVVHSSVPVGTTRRLSQETGVVCLHSPIRGKHPDLTGGITTYVKYLTHDDTPSEADEVIRYFSHAGIPSELMDGGTKSSELAKLLELSRYGVYIAFAKEQDDICKKFGVSYKEVVNEYEHSRTEGLQRLNSHHLIQPILYPFKEFVGGHCVVEDMEILLAQHEAPLLSKAIAIDKGTTIWGNCNIYPSARLGKGCSIGHGSEIGANVVIGDRVRIGAMCFIPEGVTIESDVFVAPKVTFSNDKKPPSSRECWGKILIKRGAVLGMGSIILPDVTVGENAVIGAGSIVTKDVPPGEIWYGQAAYKHGSRDESYPRPVPAYG